jgi:uncharacterized RDD family membrane protein YckC
MPIPYVTGALAAIAEPVRREKAVAAAVADAPPQASLFERPGPKVIPFDSLPGARVQSAPPRVVQFQPPASKVETPKAAAPKVSAPRRSAPRSTENQGSLDFVAPPPKGSRTLASTSQPTIYCDAPVAVPSHRAIAGALDFSVVLIAYSLFLCTFWIGGGAFELNKVNTLVFAGAFVILMLLYGGLYILGNSETAGLRWMSLRLTNFDGFEPNRTERLLRGVGTIISVSTGGLGLLWTLLDEEKLAWQDHISKTFPTWRSSRQ